MIITQIKKPYIKLVSRSLISETAQSVLLNIAGTDCFDLNIIIGSDDLLHKYNLQYRGIDKATDVLSFESGIVDPETGITALGDILISYDSAEKQANESGHSVENEIRLLLIHGILHLSGYDHYTTEEKEIMWAKQNELLALLNIQINHISGDSDFHD